MLSQHGIEVGDVGGVVLRAKRFEAEPVRPERAGHVKSAGTNGSWVIVAL